MYLPHYISPYLTMVGNQLAWIGTVNLIVKNHAFETTKHHFERQEKKKSLKTQYVKTENSGNVVNLFGNKNKP